MSKRPYKLTHDELMTISGMVAQCKNPQTIWEGICKRLGVDMASLEDARTGDAHDFLASPLKMPIPEPETGIPAALITTALDVRGGHTSASNAEADLRCPGRHLAQKGLPDEPKGEWAEHGTKIHAALAADKDNDPNAASALTLEEHDTFAACREVEKAVVTAFFDENGKSPTRITVKRHERYWIPSQNGQQPRFQHSGEADVVYRSGVKALILDYKVLTSDIPEAPSNMQLRDLACLVYANVPLLDTIGVAIIQPLVTRKPVPCLYTKPDLERATQEMVQRVIASNSSSTRVAGEVQCKFCKAKKSCSPHALWAGSMMPVQSNGVLSTPMLQWTPEQRAIAADLVGLAESKLAEIWAFLKAGVEKDAAFIPGWKLKPGNVVEKVADVQKLFDRFTSLGGTLPAFFPCITVVKGELKKAVSETTGAKGKQLSAAMETLLEGITESKQNSPSLVKEDK